MISSLAVPRGAENHYGAPGYVGQKLTVEAAFLTFVDKAGVVNIKIYIYIYNIILYSEVQVGP